MGGCGGAFEALGWGGIRRRGKDGVEESLDRFLRRAGLRGLGGGSSVRLRGGGVLHCGRVLVMFIQTYIHTYM